MQTSVSEERWKFIGGSDIPIIMNLSPFKTRWQLLKEKAQVEETRSFSTIYTEYGNVMEPKIRAYVNEALAFNFEEGKAIGGDIRIHTDGEDVLKRCILEVKTTSKIYDSVIEYKHYLVQLLFYMNERDFDDGLLAVYERPEDMDTTFDSERLTVYSVQRKDYADLIAEIYEEIDLFRRDLEKVKTNPFITEEELIPLDTRLIAQRLINIKIAKGYFEEFKAQEEALVAKLGELYTAEKRKTAEIGGYKVTFTPAKEQVTKTTAARSARVTITEVTK